MIPLCLVAGSLVVTLPGQSFTLAWTHSIEKVRWEEDWRLTGEGLEIVEARIKGSGAGMEIPDGAVLREGSWHYRPSLPPLAELRLTHSPYAGEYELCFSGACESMTHWLPDLPSHAVLEIRACT